MSTVETAAHISEPLFSYCEDFIEISETDKVFSCEKCYRYKYCLQEIEKELKDD